MGLLWPRRWNADQGAQGWEGAGPGMPDQAWSKETLPVKKGSSLFPDGEQRCPKSTRSRAVTAGHGGLGPGAPLQCQDTM